MTSTWYEIQNLSKDIKLNLHLSPAVVLAHYPLLFPRGNCHDQFPTHHSKAVYGYLCVLSNTMAAYYAQGLALGSFPNSLYLR